MGCSNSKHNGTGHKIAHNMTTLMNIPLVAWAIYTIFSLRYADYDGFSAWMAQPINMIAAIIFVVVTLKHFTLELEVVLEDYISNIPRRNLIIKLLKIFWLVLGLATIISILKLGF